MLIVTALPGQVSRGVLALQVQQQHEASASTDDRGATTMTDARLAQLLAQAGAIGILAVVLFFYRRDFMKKNEAEVQRSDQIVEVLEKSTDALVQSAVATSEQTGATHRLARAVENIERRQAGLPPSAKGSELA